MEKLKALFGTEALTFEQLQEKLKDNTEVKLANLALGGYVDKEKYEEEKRNLETANKTIKELQENVKKFDGVDVEGLKTRNEELEKQYKNDLLQLKLDSAIDLGLLKAKAKNPKLAKAALDMSIIKLDGDNLIGFNEQLDNLKETDSYLFDVEGTDKEGARVTTGTGHTTNTNTDNFMSAFMKGAGIEETKGEK